MALVGKPGICSNCLTETRRESYIKPWAWIGMAVSLLLVVAIVGIVTFFICLLAGGGKRCPKCKTENGVLDIDTPAAKLLKEKAGAPKEPEFHLVKNKHGGFDKVRTRHILDE